MPCFSEAAFKFKIWVNNRHVHQVENSSPQAFENVKVFVSNPWSSNMDGYIRGLNITTMEGKFKY